MKKYFLALSLFLCSLVAIFFVKKMPLLKDIPITKITQLSLQKEALSSLYLTELLDLSYDKKKYRADFDMEGAHQKLLSSPLISEATISFVNNGNILVKYGHVTPIARLGDFVNCGIDKEGNIFPLLPFFSKEGLPKIYLGMDTLEATQKIDSQVDKSKWLFARKCLSDLGSLDLLGKIILVDVSKILEESLGKNEMVVVIEYLNRKDYLRLSKRNYLNEVSNYIILCDKLKDETGSYMIDFRFESCAFIEKF